MRGRRLRMLAKSSETRLEFAIGKLRENRVGPIGELFSIRIPALSGFARNQFVANELKAGALESFFDERLRLQDAVQDRPAAREKFDVSVAIDSICGARAQTYRTVSAQHAATFRGGAVGELEMMKRHRDENQID